MASAIEKSDEKDMSEEESSERGERDERREPPRGQSPAQAGKSGFFRIYKSGQGYWTRMGSAAGAGVIGLFIAHFIYADLRPRIPWFERNPNRALIAALIFLAVWSMAAYWFINKPRNADFLIATDSEMKKVNWTSRKDLIGSTKVVVFFMFLIAFLLFAIDIIFGYLFYLIGVLKSKPF